MERCSHGCARRQSANKTCGCRKSNAGTGRPGQHALRSTASSIISRLPSPTSRRLLHHRPPPPRFVASRARSIFLPVRTSAQVAFARHPVAIISTPPTGPCFDRNPQVSVGWLPRRASRRSDGISAICRSQAGRRGSRTPGRPDRRAGSLIDEWPADQALCSATGTPAGRPLTATRLPSNFDHVRRKPVSSNRLRIHISSRKRQNSHFVRCLPGSGYVFIYNP